jgi:hypothetical protein
MRKKWMLVLAAACCFLALGCAGDLGKQVMANTEMQARVMDMIAGSQETAAAMADRLVANDTTRAVVIEKLIANPTGSQAVMEAVARNETVLDGALNLAMQDPAMREHVLTLFKGMRMAGVK